MSDDVERQPLWVDVTEARVLAVCVEICTRIDAAVLVDEEARQMAHEEILARYGPRGAAREDQALAAARERLPVLRRLRTALGEIGERLSEG